MRRAAQKQIMPILTNSLLAQVGIEAADYQVSIRQESHMSTDAHQQRILSRFTEMAEVFATVPQFTDRESLDALVALTAACETDSSLDVACGAGVVACHFAARVQQAAGIDITPAMLDQARLRQAGAGLDNVEWYCGDVNALPFADATFSIVTSRYAIHHLLEPARVLKEMARVCRPGGRIAIADICLPDETVDAALYNRIETMNDASHARALTESDWLRESRVAGLALRPAQRYRLEFPLARMLERAGHARSVIDGIELEVRNAIQDGRLAGCARLQDGRCQFIYPITVFLCHVQMDSVI